MKDEKKSFHNPKTAIIKEPNTKKKIKIDFRTTQKNNCTSWMNPKEEKEFILN